MSEKERSSPGGQEIPAASAPVPRGKKPRKGLSVAALAHELRTPLGVLTQTVEVLKRVPFENAEVREPFFDSMQRNLKALDDSVNKAVNQKHSLNEGRQVHRMFIDAFPYLVDTVDSEDSPCARCIYEDEHGQILAVGKEVPPGDPAQNTVSPRVVLKDMDEHIQSLIILGDEIAIRQICKNTIANAVRKGATKITIHFAFTNGTQDPCVDIIISDNGEGILPEKLMVHKAGGTIETDKDERDHIVSKAHHGHGLSIIEEHAIRSDGALLIESRHKSMYPENHGTDIILRIPLQMSPSAVEHAAQPTADAPSLRDAGNASATETVVESSPVPVARENAKDAIVLGGEPSPVAVSRMSRRRMLEIGVGAAGTFAAGIGGILYVAKGRQQGRDMMYAETAETSRQHFIPAITVQDNQIVSLTFRHPELGELLYKKGEKNMLFSDSAHIDTGGVSRVAIDIKKEKGMDRMMVGAADHIIFGFVAAPRDGANATYICIVQNDAGELDYREFPLRDTVKASTAYVSNREFLQLLQNDQIYNALRKLKIPATADPTARKWMTFVNGMINMAVKNREHPDASAVIVRNTLPDHAVQSRVP